MNDFTRTERKLDGFKHEALGPSGLDIQEETINRAKSLLLYAKQYAFDGCDAFPAYGICIIALYYRTDDLNCLEIQCFDDGTYDVAWEYGVGVNYVRYPIPEDPFTESDVCRLIDWWWDELHSIKLA